MKAELKNLLSSECAFLKLNKFSRLKHVKFTRFGEDVDNLIYTFDGRACSEYSRFIKSRDIDGIISEVLQYQKEAFDQLSEKLNCELSNGYLSV